MQDVREAFYVGSRSDGTLTRRPMSPHLQVYKMRLSMFMSIASRVTGVVATAGAALAVGWLAALAWSPAAFARARKVTGSVPGQVILAGWILSLVWHMVGGLRHFLWDTGHRYQRRAINRDGRIALGVILLTAAGLTGAVAGVSRMRAVARTGGVR